MSNSGEQRNLVDNLIKLLLEHNMKHIIQYMNKYEDVAEALKNCTLCLMTAIIILGLAPAIMILQAANF